MGEPNKAFAKYFIDESFLAKLRDETLSIYNVTFEPGCKNNWHIHHAKSGRGQVLICIADDGFYQEFGKDAVKLTSGKIITIEAGVRHWHGAMKDSWMSHLAIEIPGLDAKTEWCKPVNDNKYLKLK